MPKLSLHSAEGDHRFVDGEGDHENCIRAAGGLRGGSASRGGPALLQRRESDLCAAKEEVPERTYTGRASVFDVYRATEDEGAKRMGERPLKLLAKSVAAGVSGPDTASSLTEP